MGDVDRNVEFATFIRKNFPKAKHITVVADGKGELARKLANKDFLVTVIENKPRFVGQEHKSISYVKGWFTRDTKLTTDLIVAMHPDEATAEVILAAEKNHLPWAVVPCCVKGSLDVINGVNSPAEWIKRLKSLCHNSCREYLLKISGKNLVLFKTLK